MTNANLSPRKLQVLTLLSQGYNQEETGAKLGITPGTVKNHVSGSTGQPGILELLGAKNITHAVYIATASGLLSSGISTNSKCARCSSISVIRLGNGRVICWYCGQPRITVTDIGQPVYYDGESA